MFAVVTIVLVSLLSSSPSSHVTRGGGLVVVDAWCTTMTPIRAPYGPTTTRRRNLHHHHHHRYRKHDPQGGREDGVNGRWRVSVLHSNDDRVAGTFFNEVPDDDDDNKKNNDNDEDKDDEPIDPIDANLFDIIRKRKAASLSSEPSTIQGMPSSRITDMPGDKPYFGIGPTGITTTSTAVNNPSKPEMDDQGYTLYSNEKTGEKKRVFEALVEYPCLFTLKIVGANEGQFVNDMIHLVADSCNVQADTIQHSIRESSGKNKWTSITVHAPVKSAEMLYKLYETIDLDPRVRFKF